MYHRYGRYGLLWTVLFAVALSLAVPWPLSVLRAEGPGVIVGRVVNRTAGSGVDGEVVLHIHRNSTGTDDHLRAKIGEDGRFRFEGLTVDADLFYEVSNQHGGVEYLTDALQFEGGQTEIQVELPVWETTDRNPGITVEQAAVFVLGVDQASQSLQIMEIATLKNPSDRAYVPKPEGPDGPMGLLRFSVPSNATDFEPAFGLDPGQIIEVDLGFALMAPLPPGQHQVGYGYRLGYDASQFSFVKSLAMGAREFRFLVPMSGPSARSDLGRLADAQVGPHTYQVFGRSSVPPGSRIAVDLSGLPTRPVWQAAPGQVPVAPILGIGAVVAGLVVLFAVVRSSGWLPLYGRESGVGSPESMENDGPSPPAPLPLGGRGETREAAGGTPSPPAPLPLGGRGETEEPAPAPRTPRRRGQKRVVVQGSSPADRGSRESASAVGPSPAWRGGGEPAAAAGPSPAARERGASAASGVRASPGADQEALLIALADLDDLYEQGQIEAGVYGRRRALLKQQLLDAMRRRSAGEEAQ